MGASGLELKTGASIMAIGGFTGSDDSPTLEQFQRYVADHEVRYFIAGEPFGPPGRHESGTASEITSWVEKNFTPIKVGGTTVYDLSAPPRDPEESALILTRGSRAPCCYRRGACEPTRRSKCP